MAEVASVEQTNVLKPLAQYKDLLSVSNMAEVLGVSQRTIYRLVDNDELPAVKVGRRLYFPRQSLIKALHLGGEVVEPEGC